MKNDESKELLLEFLLFIEGFPQITKEIAYYVFMLDLIDSNDLEHIHRIISNFKKHWPKYNEEFQVFNKDSYIKYLLGFIGRRDLKNEVQAKKIRTEP